MSKAPQKTDVFEALVEIVAALRAPNGCPWDLQQTHSSLVPFAIEEIYEMVDAIESKDDQHLQEELGDVLFQVVIHAELARQRNAFAIKDVIQNICEKIVRRHPHVFTEQNSQISSDQVLQNWETIKQQEKKTAKPNALDVPVNLPALQRASKIGFRSAKVKFDWRNPQEVWQKVQEEFDELKTEINQFDSTLNQTDLTKQPDEPRQKKLEQIKIKIDEELGDLLFTLSQLGRHLELDAETSLRNANRKFENRYVKMKTLIEQDGHNFQDLPVEEKEKYWQKIKRPNS